MKDGTIGFGDLVAMLRLASSVVREEEALLSRLDSKGGDGDHGTTMVRAMDQLEKAVGEATPPAIAPLLKSVGWGIMGIDGGATGPLFGSLFMSMAAACDDDRLDGPALALLFEAGLAGVQKNTRAKVGDKTMIDALVPAVAALREAVDGGAGIDTALEQAASAAAAGAESTVALQARFGRAKNVGEQSVGSADPGATSVSLIFRAFHEGVNTDG
jgi:phosphoenolpyruvate---glycerone phosphotransferase subunit DhaL